MCLCTIKSKASVSHLQIFDFATKEVHFHREPGDGQTGGPHCFVQGNDSSWPPGTQICTTQNQKLKGTVWTMWDCDMTVVCDAHSFCL